MYKIFYLVVVTGDAAYSSMTKRVNIAIDVEMRGVTNNSLKGTCTRDTQDIQGKCNDKPK